MPTEISRIDQEIDALRVAVPNLMERSTRENELFRQRGLVQLRQDEAEEARRLAKPKRVKRPKKCPTCSHYTLGA